MIKRRDFIIAVLAAFCLIASMFLVQLARSQTLGQYDPWLDITGDGKINIEDVANVAKAFGTSGDPTRNVNVTNWPSAISIKVANWEDYTQANRA